MSNNLISDLFVELQVSKMKEGSEKEKRRAELHRKFEEYDKCRMERENSFKIKINNTEDLLQLFENQQNIENMKVNKQGIWPKNTKLINKNFFHCSFQYADMDYNTFINTKFQESGFGDTFFRKTTFLNCEMDNCNFGNNAFFSECVFDNFKTKNCTLWVAPGVLSNCTFKNTDFSGHYDLFIVNDYSKDYKESVSCLHLESNNKFENCVIDYESVVEIAEKIYAIIDNGYIDLSEVDQKTKEFLVCATLLKKREFICKNDNAELKYGEMESPVKIKKEGKFINPDTFKDFSLYAALNKDGRQYRIGKEEIYQSLCSQNINLNNIVKGGNKKKVR